MSAQNTSTAVMARRAIGQRSLDDFPTPPWGTRALIEMMKKHVGASFSGVAWEPAANRGYMVRPLQEHFEEVIASDIHDYGLGYRIDDFLFPRPFEATKADWIITNPPFTLAKDFALKGLELCRSGVALLVRTAFVESVDRYNDLFARARPDFNLQFVERLPMVNGACDPDAASATAYCWLVWLKESPRKLTIQDWIPPCRKQLERPTDYEAAE